MLFVGCAKFGRRDLYFGSRTDIPVSPRVYDFRYEVVDLFGHGVFRVYACAMMKHKNVITNITRGGKHFVWCLHQARKNNKLAVHRINVLREGRREITSEM
jgi:hypothetical protein